MSKASKKTSQVVAADATVADVNQDDEHVTVKLPIKGTDGKPSRITKETVIAPPHASTGNKERWFAKSRLVSYSKGEGGVISITIRKGDLAYRDMINE